MYYSCCAFVFLDMDNNDLSNEVKKRQTVLMSNVRIKVYFMMGIYFIIILNIPLLAHRIEGLVQNYCNYLILYKELQ